MTKILTLVVGLFLSLNTFSSEGIVLNKGNTITIDSTFDFQTTSVVAQKALELSAKLRKDEPIYLVIDSGGGGIQAGVEMIANLNGLNRPVHTICVFCASMAFQTIQGLNGDRIILPFGTMMSHKARGGFYGEFPGQLDSRLRYYKRRLKSLDNITVARTGSVHTLESYEALYENEYWCDGQDCINQGFSDKISAVSCDQSLSGERIREFRIPVRTRFGQSTLVVKQYKSACPVITGILKTIFELDGETYTFSGVEKEIENLGLGKDFLQKLQTKHRTPTMTLDFLGK